MCYLVETVLLDNIVHSISELEGALEMIAKPPSRCISTLGAGEGAASQRDQITVIIGKTPPGPHPPTPGPGCMQCLTPSVRSPLVPS